MSVLSMRVRELARMMIRFETLARVRLEDDEPASVHYLQLRDAARRRRSALLRRLWEEERAHAASDKTVV